MLDLNSLNEYGIPLHACHGYRHDEHRWEWIRERMKRGDFEPDLGIIKFTDALPKTSQKDIRAAAVQLREIYSTTVDIADWEEKLNEFARSYNLERKHDALT